MVMDPFFGSGTVGRVAAKHNRNFIGIELNPGYIEISDRLLSNVQLELINHF
ncbi:DNA methyltransferase [Bacillus cereus]|nr:DNA methyltransferase [Bacillus cereus]